MNAKPTTRRRVLVTAGTVITAAAFAIGSGASFTAQTLNPANSAEAGTLEQTNSIPGAAIYDLSNMEPGDTVNGKVTVTNSGTLAGNLALTESAALNGFSQPEMLTITITDVTNPGAPVVVVPESTYGTVGKVDLGRWAAAEAHTYVFSVTLDADADNSNQGDLAEADYAWDTTQDTTVTVTDQNF